MINLRNSPFLCFALLLLVAYGVAQSTGINLGWPAGYLLALACLAGTIFSIQQYNPGFQYISTIAICSLMLAAGMIRITHFKSEIFPGDTLKVPAKMTGSLTVTEVLKIKESGISLRCISTHLSTIETDDHQVYKDKFILVQINGFNGPPIFPGDVVQTTGWVSVLAAPLNPQAFDIRKYYRTLGIRHQLYCKNHETTITAAISNSLFRITAKWQAALSAIVNKNISEEVAQLTNALVWGDRSYMNEDITTAFANSGAMHVLSVSGMHMAMIYSMLYVLLGAPGAGNYTRRLFRFGCYSFAIILYIGLTGACPAVVRSGLMIMLFLAGKAMGWNTQIWNLLGFAAFLMLWFNPFLYENIGFQLSFLAMAGILMYAQPMIRSLSFKQIILHRIWEISAVSIAAQVFILPILLKQFHQFPLTFIASSLVAMPASYVIIFGAILNVVLYFFGIPWFWSWFDKAGYYFIQCMKWMAGLNPEMNYSLPTSGSLLLMIMAILFSIALVYRWNNGKTIAYALGLLTFCVLCRHRSYQWSHDNMIIYYHYKGFLADVIIDGQCISIQDCSLPEKGIDFSARGYRCFRDIIHTKAICKDEEFVTRQCHLTSHVLTLPTASMLIWNKALVGADLSTTYTYILIDSCPDFRALTRFICDHEQSTIILPAHLDRRTRNGLIKFLKNNAIAYYDIGEQGYFMLPL